MSWFLKEQSNPQQNEEMRSTAHKATEYDILQSF